jgi:Tfp pilus assembly protein PilF
VSEPASSPGLLRRKPECGVTLALGVLLATALFVNDRIVANGRELIVLNRTGAAAKVILPHGDPLQLESQRMRTVSLGEGTHRVLVELDGAPARPVDVSISGNVLERLLGGRVYVLNLDAAAPIVWEETIYGPPGNTPPPTPARVAMGEVLIFERVDEVFAPFPDDAPEGPRVRIGLAPGEPATLLGALAPARRSEHGPLRYAEHHLRRAPDDDELLALYVRAAKGEYALDGAAFLASRLEERPLRVLWHRAHQDLRRAAGDLAALREEYAAACAKEPGSSALATLAARLQPDPDQALAGYRAALELDPSDPFAHYGVAIHLFRRADYGGARRAIDAACKGRPRDASFANLRYLVRCGQKEWPLLVAELERALKAAPTSFPLLQRYLEALVAADQSDRAREVAQRYRQRLSDRDDPRQLAHLAKLTLHGLEGRWDELLAGLPQLEAEPVRVRLKFEAALGAGKPQDSGQPKGPSETLQLALAWALLPSGAAEAKTWRARLGQALTKGPGAWSELAPLLESGDTAALGKLALSPDDKACALYLLAAERPAAERKPYLDLAARYDLGRRFPHALLRRAAEALAGE